MIRFFFKSLQMNVFNQTDNLRSGSLVIAEDVTKTELEKIVQLTGLEKADLVDIFDIYEVPRFERHDEGLIIHIRHPREGHEGLYTELLTIIYTDSSVFLIGGNHNPVAQLILADEKIVTTQRPKMLLKILSIIARMYTMKVKQVADEVMVQKRALKKINSTVIARLLENEEVLNQYIASLIPMQNIFQILSNSKQIMFHERDRELFDDVVIGIDQSVNLSQVTLRSMTGLRDSYQIIFTNNLNNTMKFLTSFTILITIPNIIAGLFGMNVVLPFQDHRFAFWFVILVVFASCGFIGSIFYKKRWL